MSRSRVAIMMLVFAVLALGRVVTGWLPGPDEANNPIARHGTIGEPLALRAFDVTVTDVRGATGIFPDFQDPLATPGVWVVVDLQVTPRTQAHTPGLVAVVAADGRTWHTVGRNDVACPVSVPGVPSTCTAWIDVPPDALVDAELHIALNPFDQRWDDVGVMPLEVTTDEVEQWQAIDRIDVSFGEVGG